MDELQLSDLRLFARIAELGTLSAVARERNAPVSQVSRSLVRIESVCGAKLVHRSNQGLLLTVEGRTFLEYCRRMLATLDDLEGEFAQHAGQITGAVRVAASTSVAQHQLVPSLAGLAKRHPGLHVELEVGARVVDFAQADVDIAIRSVKDLPGATVARRIGTLGRKLYAAPSYAKSVGLPELPDELRKHSLVTNTSVNALNQWPFVVDQQPTVFAAEGQWKANDPSIAATMVLHGLGIGRLTTIVGDPLVRQGLLVPVLEQYVDADLSPVYAVTANGRHRLPKIRACLEYWTEWFKKEPAN